MKPNIVVDVGNSRIKWGLCTDDLVIKYASLPPEAIDNWEEQIRHWHIGNVEPVAWAVAGVNSEGCDKLLKWVKQRGDRVTVVHDRGKLPIGIEVPEPDRVGIDRLLNVVAAKSHVQREISIFIIDAGSAVTVDWVDRTGAFRGGTIFPGLRTMAQSLHDYTEALPLVKVPTDSEVSVPSLPGICTIGAIEAGIFWAVAGGIKAILRQLGTRTGALRRREVFLTGGDAHYLAPVMDAEVRVWREMTLEGIRLAAEALP
jgi:type III pantothenate kinase